VKSPRYIITTREVLIRRGVWLEIGTVAWNAIEGIIAVAAGIVPRRWRSLASVWTPSWRQPAVLWSDGGFAQNWSASLMGSTPNG
jgi:hypothetical protein